MLNTVSIILALENDENFKSKKSKYQHDILFKPMINWVFDACVNANIQTNAVIVSDKAKDLANMLPEGTAVLSNQKAILAFTAQNLNKDILLIPGDNVFIDKDTLEKSYLNHKSENNDITSVFVDFNGKKVNCNINWVKANYLLKVLDTLQNLISNDNENPLDYLNNIDGKKGVYQTPNSNCACQIHDRVALAQITEFARIYVLNKLIRNGVNIPHEQGIIISPDVEIGMDTTILPNTIIEGNTTIGEDCVIGENTHIISSKIGDNNKILNSYIEECIIHNGTKIGPYVHIRPKSEIFDFVKLGNFVEIKASSIDKYTSVAHLTYLGDSKLGKFVNVGCGVVTANYDGAEKHKTVIEDSAFIGCNTNFIPPVHIGKGSVIGAGSTIDQDVGDFALALARNKQVVKEDWALRKGKYKKGL